MRNKPIKDKESMKRSSEKQFIKTMIITGLVGLSIMVMIMTYIVKAFGTKKIEGPKEPLIPDTTVVSESEVVTQTIQGIIHDKGRQDKNIKVWHVDQGEHIKMTIKDKTQLKDSYDKAISIQEIQVGDIVKVTYEKKSKNIVMIQKSDQGWTKSNVNQLDIDPKNKKITMDHKIYNYTGNLLVINQDLEEVSVSDINPFDQLKIQGIHDTIWSIQILESTGYIKLTNIPTLEGTLEINNNQIYSLKDIKDQVPLTPGDHKVVIQMKGYVPFSEQVNVTSDVVYEIDLQGIDQAVADLLLSVTNSKADYQVEIGGKTYRKGDLIQLQPSTYQLMVTANGFEPYERKIELEAKQQRLNITLEAIAEKEEKPSQEEKPKEDKKPEKEEIKTVQIVIETEPSDAQVFVAGVYKGTTPTLTGLKPGEYNISIEKEGYTTLYTTIIIDSSNRQKGFLYALEKQE